METNDKQMKLNMANISGSTFHQVNAEASVWDDVNLSKTNITNANISGLRVDDANLSQSSLSNVNLSGLRFAMLI